MSPLSGAGGIATPALRSTSILISEATSVSFREVPDLREHGLNDRITSFEVAGNQAWEVCRDVFFAGGCRVFTGSIDDLRAAGWNDRISSLRPVGYCAGGGAW